MRRYFSLVRYNRPCGRAINFSQPKASAAPAAAPSLRAHAAVRGTAAERHARPATLENSVMSAKIPDEIEVLLKPRLLQHVVSVPAHREDLPLLHVVVVVERPPALEPGDRPLVNHGLAVVLAVRLQQPVVELEQAVRRRVELEVGVPQLVDPALHGLVLDGDGRVLHEPRVGEAAPPRQVLEVVPVQRAAEALPPEHLVVAQLFRDAAAGVHVREVQLPPRLEQPEAGFQHGLLVRAEVDDAVADDDVDGPVLQALDVVELFDQSQVEFHVVVPEPLGVVRSRLPRHPQLLLGHVHPDHPPVGSHELGGDVHVPPGPAPEVEDGRPSDLVGDAEPASVILRDDVGMHVGDGLRDVRRRPGGGAARVRLQVGRFLQRLSVVGRDGGVGGGLVDEQVRGNGQRRGRFRHF
mmetsp:Transcript_24824/g.52907  ORF Transcript_24824/g.52907 Transcript_24824/m.52907 type:complete len:409 (-) Transcript_24824:43-1269(-)